MTLDTFGRIYETISKASNLAGASSKTSAGILRWDSTLFIKSWKKWVTQLRLESLQRRKLARHTSGNDYSSLQWKTPLAEDCKNRTYAVNSRGEPKLSAEVKNWPTPYALMDQKYRYKPGSQSSDNNLSAMARLGKMEGSQQGKDITSIHGKNRAQLNPAWVAQLMGTTLDRTFFVPLATVW